MKVYTPVDEVCTSIYPKSIFLAGSIANDTAEKWQDKALEILNDTHYIVFNPRRAHWDSALEQKITNPEFKKQVDWELSHLQRAEFKLFYFDPNTQSPITLLELGLMATRIPKRCVVVCNEPFWRKGNVDIVCETYGVKQVDTLEEAIEWLKRQ